MKNNITYNDSAISNHKLLKQILLVLLFSSCHFHAIATEESYINELKGPQVAVNNTLTVSDEKFNNPGYWSMIEQNYRVDNIITFELNYDTSLYFFNQPFSCLINFKIYLYGNPGDTSQVTDSTTYADISLNVRYDTVTGKPYKGIAMYKFVGSHKYKVKILSMTSAELSPIKPIFRLKAQIIVNRHYKFQDNSTDVTRFSKVTANQLLLEWTSSHYPGAEEFDLEYTFIDSSSQVGASIRAYNTGGYYYVPSDSLGKWFVNNNSRVTTKATNYLINIPYDSGYILFRLRGVQDSLGVRIEGNWNYSAKSTSLSCTIDCPAGVVFFEGHETNLNWQYSVVFAEEGKRKEVISYFDGALRNRQSVTISNSVDKNIVQETIYDALGRPAVNILPAPTEDNTLHYFRNFNMNSADSHPYSFGDLAYSACVTEAGEVSESTGSGAYYSASNSFISEYYYAKYIPDASGFPFAVTEYMADNTGRIKAQGGVGDKFQMGGGHETKYFYGKPTQTELDRLFGLEAGNASHYLKNMVVDPNGQVSVSYVDAGGKTIATALAGESPATMHALPSSVEASATITNVLINAGDFTRDPGDFSLAATATFLAPVTGTYVFNYNVDSLVYRKLYGANKDSSICSNCYYDLEVLVKDDCENVLRRDTVTAGTVFDTACGTPPSSIRDSIHVTVSKIGEYYVSFSLRVSQDAMSFYDSVHLVKNTEIKKLNYFLLEELKNTDFYGCYNNCKTCIDKLGTKAGFTATFKLLYTGNNIVFLPEDSLWVGSLYDSLYANCQSLQAGCTENICDEKLALLKRDVSPGGQYGLFDTLDYSLLQIPINRIAMRSQLAWFPDVNGSRDSVFLKDIYGEDSVKVDVNQLSDANFIRYWRDSWADSLVKLHPEYCYYLWCLANSASNEFDRNVEDLLDADSAVIINWFDPTHYEELLDADPFFNGSGKGAYLYNQMKDSLQLFSRTMVGYSQSDKNILQFIDLILYCKNNPDCTIWDTCDPENECRSRNKEWHMYKMFYLNLKKKFYEQARRENADSTFANCSNCFIGKDLLEQTYGCPGVNDFSIQEDYPAYHILYKYCQSGGVNRPTIVRVRSQIFHGGYFYHDLLFNTGDCRQTIITTDWPVDSILYAVCDTIPWQEFEDTLCTNNNCAAGTYNPYDRDSLSFHISYGTPQTPPSSVPAGYEGCRFYPEFVLHTSPSTVCRYTNVWVCVKDSTCPGGSGVCIGNSYPSTCTPSGSDTLYRDKVRRYPEYISTSAFLLELQGQSPGDGSELNEEEMLVQGARACEAQADIWMNLLSRCNMLSGDSTNLRTALVDICTKGVTTSNVNGTSSVPGSVSITYHSFEEAIEGILGPGAINDSCTQELLRMPYPYDRQPTLVAPVISEANPAICERLLYYDTAWQNSLYPGSFHSWMKLQLGSSYTLDSIGLDDLVKGCNKCQGLLRDDIILPVPMIPGTILCLPCDSISTAFADFETKFPLIDDTDDDYEILFTNFFNHRFGYSLSYDQYKVFLDSCNANAMYSVKLCDQPMQQDYAIDFSWQCAADLFSNALTNAWNTYVVYIDSVRKDFREAWLTKCMNAQPSLTMTADLYEYHYTLYYYDQSGNLVKTVPPEGVQLLDNTSIGNLQAIRNGSNSYCSNNNSMVFTNGSINFPGGTQATQMNVGANPFTIETWINLSTLSDQGILSNNHYTSGGSFNTGYSLSVESSRLVLHLGESSSSFKVEASSPVLTSYMPLNKWAHIAIERTGPASVKMYINGNELPVSYSVNSPGTGNLNHSDTDPFYIGASNKGGNLSKLSGGKLRHVRIYTRALPAAEVRQNYNDYCGNASNMSSLVFWEQFTEGVFTASGGNDYVYDRIYNSGGQKSSSVAFEISGSNTLVPAHRLVTTYQYNSLNQVLQQYSPDGDTSVFFYDRLGRLTASQNKEQKDNASYSGSAGRFSYTLYDSLGRITEVGEKSTATNIRTINMLKQDSVLYWLGTGTDRQLTKTIYDNPVNLNLQAYNTSRKRVVASIYLENSSDAQGDSTIYAYDILGNVKTLVQHVKTLVAVDATNGRKRVDYDYDLVSGKVNLVSYQHGKGDQFYYKYLYDAENRVTGSYSSRDKLVWLEDASYNYYLHGPLARTELGQYKVQGVDYAYTLQGWLKGVNGETLDYTTDIGEDGSPNTLFGRVSRDVYAFKIGYYDGDYTPVGSAPAFANLTYVPPGSLEATGNELFNGNISSMIVNLSRLLSKTESSIAAYTYGYDQLNRLTEMRSHGSAISSHWSNTDIIDEYKESIAYDANGNILKYLRNGVEKAAEMDSLNYKYHRDGSGNLVNNRLNHVRDEVVSTNYTVDIDDQGIDNYRYDKIGNLISDNAEQLDTVRWTVYGKINRIVKTGGETIIDYGYDPGGNRTFKKVTTDSGDTTRTYYIRDAQGNVLAIYSKLNTEPIVWNEQHLYGSSRLGMWNPDTTVAADPPVVISTTPVYDSIMVGSRTYELSNHLGNVLSTISDKKIGVYDETLICIGDCVTTHYIAEVLSQNDYYPFGMGMPGRQYSAGDAYRYGFNGKENDNEVKGEGNQQDYGMRIYDPRIGRFLSVDPLTKEYPWYTPYQFSGNSPIVSVDIDGLEPDKVLNWIEKFAVGIGKGIIKHDDSKPLAMQLYTFSTFNQHSWYNEHTGEADKWAKKNAEYRDNPLKLLKDAGSTVVNGIRGGFNDLTSGDPEKMGRAFGELSMVAADAIVTHAIMPANVGARISTSNSSKSGGMSSSTVLGADVASKLNASGSMESSLFGKPTPNIINTFEGSVGVRTSTELRKVGSVFESIDDVMANPNLLKGKSPLQVEGIIGKTPGWKIESLGQGSQMGNGWVLRHYNAKGNPTGPQIRWHPGGGHHGPNPYWRVVGRNGDIGGIIR